MDKLGVWRVIRARSRARVLFLDSPRFDYRLAQGAFVGNGGRPPLVGFTEKWLCASQAGRNEFVIVSISGNPHPDFRRNNEACVLLVQARREKGDVIFHFHPIALLAST
jgi:hypothetical protein